MRAPLLIAALVCGLCSASPARGAGPHPAHRQAKLASVAAPAPPPMDTSRVVPGSVAVLEYRTAVEQLGDLPQRLAQTMSLSTSLRVVDLTEARRRFGPRLDGEVAACSGAAACLSRLGARLEVGQILLMAVSQLGDVVLALQRIDVVGQRVAGRVADALPEGGSAAVDEARILGWLQQLYPPETFKRYGKIVIKTDVDGAQVYINAKARGQTPLSAPLELLAPGNYRLLVEKPRFLPFQAVLSIMPDTTTEVAAKLVHEVQPTPWYKRWYVWAAIGGVAVAGVGAVALYYGAFNQNPVDTNHVPGFIKF